MVLLILPENESKSAFRPEHVTLPIFSKEVSMKAQSRVQVGCIKMLVSFCGKFLQKWRKCCDFTAGPQGDPGPRGGEGRGVLGDAELLVPPLPRPRHRRGHLRLQVRSCELGLCQFRFQKFRNSDSLTGFGLFSGINSGIVGQKNRKRNRTGIVFRFTIPPFRER